MLRRHSPLEDGSRPVEDTKGREDLPEPQFLYGCGEKVDPKRYADRRQTPSLPADPPPAYHHPDVAGDEGTGPRTTTELLLVLRSQGLAVPSALVTTVSRHLTCPHRPPALRDTRRGGEGRFSPKPLLLNVPKARTSGALLA